jgi:multicomponent Na+:H+ antiporter subunit D
VVIVSVLTMVCGVLGAAAQMEMRRVLSFHIISQIGYMILGLGLLTVASIGAAIFYTVHHIIVKTNLFLISGIVARLGGTGKLKQLGGLYRDHPGIAFLFMIPAMSLAGVPPLSGFFAKFTLIKSAFEVESWWPAAAALAVGLLTMFSMIKIWNEVFWKPRPEDAPVPAQARTPMLMVLPAVLMACVTIAIGVFPGALLDIATGAAEQLKQPAGYIEAVLRLRAP